MIDFMRRFVHRLGVVLIACLAAVSAGCVTWEEHPGSRGTGKEDAEVAIFRAGHRVHRIVSTADLHEEYERIVKSELFIPPGHILRLLPGHYRITVFGFERVWSDEFEVNLRAGHTYEEEADLCYFGCGGTWSNPFRMDHWIKDITTSLRVSDVKYRCWTGEPSWSSKTRIESVRFVPCRDYGPCK
jgi:hypothetical protein